MPIHPAPPEAPCVNIKRKARAQREALKPEAVRPGRIKPWCGVHEALASGRWQKMTLAEQLGNIGSEVSRVRLSLGKDEKKFAAAQVRALELIDLTAADPRWTTGRRELTRLKEIFIDAVSGGQTYHTTLDDLQKYLDVFALNRKRA